MEIEKYLNVIDKFVDKMGYKKDEHFLGVYFYGSALTGFANRNSDIDLHVVFDDSDPTHIYRGVHFVDGYKIEYFEKCIGDLYLSVKNDIQERNIAWHSMLVNSKILFDKTGKLKELREYTAKVYANGLPKLDEQDAMEYVAIIDNRMEKLRILMEEDAESFYHIYQITIEKIRRFYHGLNGFPRINTSKIYRVYKNDEYRKSYYEGDFVNDEFKNLYYNLIAQSSQDKRKLYQDLKKFYEYVKDGRKLPEGNYKIKIKSRNMK